MIGRPRAAANPTAEPGTESSPTTGGITRPTPRGRVRSAARRHPRVLLLGSLAAMALLLTGCLTGNQSSLDAAGPYARSADRLFNYVFIIVVIIFVLVEGAIVTFLIKYRERKGDKLPVQVHGNTRAEAIWTIIPAVIMAGVAVPTVKMIIDFARTPPAATRVNVTVTGHQWWWQYTYKDASGKTLAVTANELHIPVNRPVYLSLQSVDVIHSFWVPRLAGKQDVNPGHTNHLTIQADVAGDYYGQCSQFCGMSHANMRLRVMAESESDYDAWLTAQQQPAATPTDPVALQGMDLFLKGRNGSGYFASTSQPACSSCHTIGGTAAQGQVGPNLTHVYSRELFAGDIFDMTPANLTLWLENPPKQKPGSIMPNLGLSSDEINALVTYLQTLK